MFIAPLLTFLPHAIVHHHDAIVAHASDHWLGDAAACGDLRHAWLVGYSVYEVGRGCFLQETGVEHRHRRRRFLCQRAACKARHHHLTQHGIVLAQHEVEGAGGAQIYLLNDGLMAHVAHLYGGLDGRQIIYGVDAFLVGYSPYSKCWEINARSYHAASIYSVGNGSTQ